MNIIGLKIENFRSIDSVDLNLRNYNVLLGKNNVGKSNVFKAIDIFWKDLNQLNNMGFKNKQAKFISRNFRVNKDLPKNILKSKTSKKKSLISLTFELNESELSEFRSSVLTRAKTDGIITLQLLYSKHEQEDNGKFRIDSDFLRTEAELNIKLSRDGRSIIINKKEVVSYITNNFDIRHINAIRTEETSNRLINDLISEKLKQLESNDVYQKCISDIRSLQNEILTEMSVQVKKQLTGFVNVKDLKIISNKETLLTTVRNNFDIEVDDGILTHLDSKGDGVKSIIAISLLKNYGNDRQNLLILVDEPEAHLHSGAIKELRKNLQDLSKENQLIVATHHQLFVNRTEHRSNLIFENKTINQCENIKELRDILGVGVEENLLGTEVVVLVEGETDKNILNTILRNNVKMNELINANTVSVVSMKGAKHIKSSLISYNNALCKVICLVDNDVTSKELIDNCLEKGLIEPSKVRKLPLVNNRNEVEIEDMLDSKYVDKIVSDFYDTDLLQGDTRFRHLKFSDRYNKICETKGLVLGKQQLNQIKEEIAKKVISEENIEEHLEESFIDVLKSIEIEIFKLLAN